MTEYQRAKRIWFWRGSLPVLLAFSIFMLASSMASAITS